MSDRQQLRAKASLSLHEAGQLLATGKTSAHAVETMLAHAIENCELQADIKRWATEQWEGRQLAGNINRLETFIERTDLDAWLKGHAVP